MDIQNNSIRLTKFLPGIAWFLLVLVLICLPGEDVPETPWITMPDFDKLVHAALFGGIVFWFSMPFKKSSMLRQQKIHLFLKLTIATVVWGITTELIQKYFITGRQFDLMDFAADSIGAIAAFFVSRKFFL
ncbi:MAG: VanZ family protein [Chitinophagaceae bacterium]|nr:VanZ family protein [Chitinophagaceae bacterium]